MEYYLTQIAGDWVVNVNNDEQIVNFKTLSAALKFIDQTEADS